MADSCEDSNEFLSPIRGRKFLQDLSSYQLLKVDSTLWSFFSILLSTDCPLPNQSSSCLCVCTILAGPLDNADS
jgi:hypothetical protein